MYKKYYSIKKCRLCGSGELKNVFNLGKTPLANNLVNIKFKKKTKYLSIGS